MPRGPRLDAPGLVHHVIQRGVDRRAMFLDDRDRRDFLRRLGAILVEEEVRCFAWALMPNHVHLLLQTGPRPLARAMHRIGTGYALRFNRRHDRVGHLVQNRFRSRVAEDDGDVKGLIRYVHANPLRAGMVDSLRSLARFPWCGHGALAGERAAAPFHAVGAALLWFDADPVQARAQLREWMDLAALERDRLDASKPRDETPAFAGLVALRDRLCALHGVDRAALASGARDRATSRVRREVACAGVTRFGLAATQVASLVGASRQAVRSAALRARGDEPEGVSR